MFERFSRKHKLEDLFQFCSVNKRARTEDEHFPPQSRNGAASFFSPRIFQWGAAPEKKRSRDATESEFFYTKKVKPEADSNNKGVNFTQAEWRKPYYYYSSERDSVPAEYNSWNFWKTPVPANIKDDTKECEPMQESNCPIKKRPRE
jgi:hypothetical protein